jgi:hypothetical protein
MTEHSTHSIVLDLPRTQVWQVIRDFNGYPTWVDGVTDSVIEDDLPGTTVGAVRDFGFAGHRQRQRLVAHSDVDCSFSYEGVGGFVTADGAVQRIIDWYRGTLRLRDVGAGAACLAEWSADYECPPADAAYWADWWRAALPEWLGSLERHLAAPVSG